MGRRVGGGGATLQRSSFLSRPIPRVPPSRGGAVPTSADFHALEMSELWQNFPFLTTSKWVAGRRRWRINTEKRQKNCQTSKWAWVYRAGPPNDSIYHWVKLKIRFNIFPSLSYYRPKRKPYRAYTTSRTFTEGSESCGLFMCILSLPLPCTGRREREGRFMIHESRFESKSQF